jgi:predicted metalloprotease with PDZ domain
MTITAGLTLALAILATGASGVAAAQGWPSAKDQAYLGPITLKVDVTDLDHKVVHVRESLPVAPGPLTLLYPQWIPGNHAPTNELKRLTGLRIEAAGKSLAWRRDREHLHAIHVDVPADVGMLELVFQQVLPLEPSGSDPLLGRRLLDLQWQGVVLYPAGHHASRIDVDASLRLPAGWQHGSALRPASSSKDELRFERVSLETLIDSPVFAGKHFKRVDLDPGAARPVFLDLVADDPAALEFKEEPIEAHRKLVRQADRLFGARHFAHYDVLLALGEESYELGLEHHQSSENSAKTGYFKDWPKNSFERYIVPHEFVHSWNGKFRRPADLWTPDFNTPARNSLLWVYEGQTQYWGDVLSVRSGMVGEADMRERFARKAAWAQHGDRGRQWRSLQSTTDDEIIAGRKLPIEWFSWQRFEEYYDEGALIWLDVDARIRELSGGQRSLDDFARGFFGVEDGRLAPLMYTFDDVVAELKRVQPFDWASYLRAKLDKVGSEAPLDGLARSGWRLAWSDQQSDYAKSIDTYFERADFLYSIGLRIGKEGKIDDVLWDGPAFRAGLAKGPTVLAVNLRAYKAELLQEAITAAKAGALPIELLLKDGNEFRIVRIEYRGGLRYPKLERVEGTPDLLTPILSAR